MAITRSDDLFGDGSGGNPQVPIDTGNPPGYASDNRGIAFGEQLTSAIANRSHYALALNDDDLDDRVNLFETAGLDAAYDLGVAAVTGGGRVITKDGGAVETQSASAGLYVDDPVSAHWRANALGDTAGSSVGFDFVGKRSSADALSGFDPVAGFMDRRAIAIPSGSGTEVDYQNAAILRPSGEAANIVRLSTGTFFTGSADQSEILFGVDLVEIEGSASSDGLYIINATGNQNTDAELQDLNGQSPTFPTNDEGCTVTLYRSALSSFGYTGRNTPMQGVSIRGLPDTNTALSILPGRDLGSRGERGSENALRVFGPSPSSGVLISTLLIDTYGRIASLSNQDTVPETDGVQDDTFYGPTTAGFLSHKTGLSTNSEEVGFLARGEGLPADSTRYDFLSLVNVRRDGSFNTASPGTEGEEVGFPFTFLGADIVRIDSGVNTEWWAFVPQVGTLAYISEPSSERGLYTVTNVDLNTGESLTLASLSGASPSLPGSGTGTITFLYANHTGRGPGYQVAELGTGRASDLVASACFVAGSESNATALALSSPNWNGSSFLRCTTPVLAGGIASSEERFYVDRDGSMGLTGTMHVGSVGSSVVPRFLHDLEDSGVTAYSLLYQGRREDLADPLTLRQYLGNSGGAPTFLHTVNAEQDGLGFSYDDSTSSASAMELGAGSFNLMFFESGLAEPFGPEKRLIVTYNSGRDSLDMNLYGWLEFNSTDTARNPNNSDSVSNTVTPKHIDKMWCTIEFVGGSPFISEGVNAASVAFSGEHIVITLVDSLGSQDAVVIPSGMGTPPFDQAFAGSVVSTSEIRVSAYNITDGTLYDMSTAIPSPARIAVLVKGEQ